MKTKEISKVTQQGEKIAVHEKEINQNNIKQNTLKNEVAKFNHILVKEPNGMLINITSF